MNNFIRTMKTNSSMFKIEEEVKIQSEKAQLSQKYNHNENMKRRIKILIRKKALYYNTANGLKIRRKRKGLYLIHRILTNGFHKFKN
jgi:hypothetical protein